ncbi:c-type cytochrome [Filibacter tadaridae]|uniref:Cytochrome c n=1 Tax=Filibacter tadaridae TaxID=2483811 RepID=A0A3P5X1D0_9BACL|nr:c-type cytochrome [Filibacter tadaridae]VDC25110.1 Cytochrome c [Filibacter tadaridae]
MFSYKKATGILFLLLLLALVIVGCSSEGYDAAKIRKELSNLDPDDPETKMIQYGKELFDSTKTVLPEHVGNNLSCISCHGDGGLSANSPMVGVTVKYPKDRSGTWTTIEDRINGCFLRSMNGTELEMDSEEMKAMVSYMEFISKDVETVDDITWRMTNDREKVPEPNVNDGAELFVQKTCITCHAGDGSGTSDHTGPALWGEGSFNEGAGLTRLSKATAFIQNNMPKGQANTLTDQEAVDLAAFVLSHDRPEGDPEKIGDSHKDPEKDYMFKERREKLKTGEFQWTDLDVVVPKKE